MSSPYTKLLRRTLVALGVGLATVATLPAVAQKVTLTGASGNSCTYSEMKVLPNGTIQVTCIADTVNPPPAGAAVFSINATTTWGAANSTGTVTISRTGGPDALIYFNHSLSGDCHSGTAPLAMGKDTTLPIAYVLLNSGSCLIRIHDIPSPHVVNNASVTISIGAPPPPPPPPPPPGNPPPAGCPAIPDGAKYQTMDKWWTLNGAPATQWNAVDQLRMASGQVAYYDVIAPPDPAMSIVNKFTQGQQPASPTGNVITEFTVSKCPGVISSAVPECYMQNTSTNQNEIRIHTAAIPWRMNQAEIGYRGCFAPQTDANGQPQKWYVNVRWTYSSCSFSNGCGFSMQWAQENNY